MYLEGSKERWEVWGMEVEGKLRMEDKPEEDKQRAEQEYMEDMQPDLEGTQSKVGLSELWAAEGHKEMLQQVVV